MNKFQRASAGIYGAIENTLDDLRHTWERVMYGREITDDVNMFPHVHKADEHQLERASAFEKCFGRSGESGNAKEYERDLEPDLDKEQEIER